MKRSRTIKVNYLARVEGEGALYIRIRDNRVADVKLRIFEPPRFFEAFLRGRDYAEVPDITARICGICPMAYQMSAVHALEDAFGVEVDGPLRDLRRLIYCGEWIESHVLHIFMLHAPDFLGYDSVLDMARDHGALVEKSLRLKKIGNDVMTLLGGREIHPINVRVGGFHKLPRRRDLRALAEDLKWARDAAVEAAQVVAGFDFPELERDYDFVALRHPHEYPLNEGRIVSSGGIDIPVSRFREVFEETHVEHSNALHSHVKSTGGAYLVGPLARYNLNFDRLSPLARETAAAAGLGATCRNPFRSIVVRAVETVWACDEALRILDGYSEPDAPAVPFEPKAGTGHGCTEAPRGILYHRYEVGDDGIIREASITPPTSQNQKTIEEDLHEYVSRNVERETDRLRHECEQAIRNYDPCISCATHFLDLTVERD